MLKDGVRSSRCTTIGERAYTPNIKTLASTAQTALDSTRVTPASNPSPLFFAEGGTPNRHRSPRKRNIQCE